MTLRQTLYPRPCPIIWLMTDPRFGERLLPAIQRLPPGSGVIFRHYELDDEERYRLFKQVRRISRRRGLVVLLADSEIQARRWHADGFHSRGLPRKSSRCCIRSAPVHNVREIAKALRLETDILFLSPLFATASHPGARFLGPTAFNRLASLANGRAVIALGGMNARKFAMLDKHIVSGWAAIDALI